MVISNKETVLKIIEEDYKTLENILGKNTCESYFNDLDDFPTEEPIERLGRYNIFVDEELFNDKDFMTKVATTLDNIYELASAELCNDKDFVLKTLRTQNPYFFYNISDNLKNNREFMLQAAKINETVFRYGSEEVRGDKKIVNEILHTASQNCNSVLESASEELRNDKEFVLEAVKLDGRALEYASDSLRNDEEVALEAIKTSGSWAFCDVSEELRHNKDFVIKALKTGAGGGLKYVSEALRDDKDVALAAVQSYGYALQYVSDELKNDKDVAIAAVQSDYYALKYASNELRNDRDVVLAAVQSADRQKDICLHNVSLELREEIDSCGFDNWIKRELHRQETDMPPMGNVADTLKAAYAKKQDTISDTSNRDTKNKDTSDISDDKR